MTASYFFCGGWPSPGGPSIRAMSVQFMDSSSNIFSRSSRFWIARESSRQDRALAAVASTLSARYGAPAMLMGLLLGMAFHFASDMTKVTAGTELMAGPALRMGVSLLGARLAFSDLAQLGWEPIVFLVFTVGVTTRVVCCARS